MDLRAQSLSLTLRGRKVLDDVSLELSGGFVGLVGPNGAGKSSLLRLLAGLWSPDAGAVTLDGKPLSRLSPAARARLISFLPPERDVSWPLPASHVVALGRFPHRGAFAPWTEEDDAAVARALKAVDGEELAPRAVSRLSNGERARVLFARALAVEAPVLLVDEATAALDPAHQFQVMELLKGEAAKGVLVIAALHDLTLAHHYCDTAVIISKGKLYGSGVPGEVLTGTAISDVYGVTATVAQVEGREVLLPLGLAEKS